MRALALVLLFGAEPVVVPTALSQFRGLTPDGRLLLAPEPALWEGDIVCGNGATPSVGVPRFGRVRVVCDARKDGGR